MVLKTLGVAAAVAAGTLAGSAAFAEPIVLGTAPNMQTAAIVVAMSEGYFEDAGLEVETVKFTSGRRALEALLGGQLDLAFMAEYPVVLAGLNEQDFGVVTVLSTYSGNRLVSKGSVGFESMKDLDGKSIGTTRGSNTEFFTEQLVEAAGIDVEIVNVAPPDIVPALARGDIDAGVMFPDFYPAAHEALGDDYREYVSDDYVSYFVLSASPAMLNDRADELKAFLEALIKADAFIEENPDAAKQAVADASEGLLPMETIEASWDDFDYPIGFDPGLMALLAAEAEWVGTKGLVPADPDVAKIRAHLITGPMSEIDPSRVDLGD